MEIKYTSNGKKVVVIGNLNSQEKIVQEIFIVNGQEVPSGENFIVKSLHDAPAISWEEKRTKEIKEHYEKVKKEYDSEIDSLKQKLRQQSSKLRELVSANAKIIQTISPQSFENIVSFLSGDMKWILVTEWDYKILPYDEFNIQYDDKLKLISLYGKSDGSLLWKINDYYDGSGSWKGFYAFKTKGEAILKLSEILLSKDKYWHKDIDSAREYGITLNPDKVKAWADNELSNLNKVVTEKEESLVKAKNNLSEFIKKNNAS